MAVIKKTPMMEKMQDIAETAPFPVNWMLPDPYDPSSYIMPVGGFTKQAAKRIAASKAKDFPMLKKELGDLIKVIGATPKKAISYVKEFGLLPGAQTSGSFHPNALRIFPSEFSSTMVGSFGHEAGHGASNRIAGKLIAKDLPSAIRNLGTGPENLGHAASQSNLEAFEGAAEYLGKSIQEKAGLIPNVAFGYGESQKKVFEELSKMASKNPYMNVFRYLQKVLGK